MQIHQLFKVDYTIPFIVACSGGVDSMAIVDFYKRGLKNFKAAYFNHGTEQANIMEKHVENWCKENDVSFLTAKITSTIKPAKLSPEEYWRNERYNWLLSFGVPVITAHHANDVAETWIFSAINGTPKLIQAKNGLIYRPFLTNDKVVFRKWCERHNVSWIDDASNNDIHFPRNRIRHNILPECMEINPGLIKVMRKKYPTSLGQIE